MVMVGTKWEESARVEMLFSWCCRWFFPITRPAVHELERNVTTAEHTATMRYLMNAFMFWLISILPPFSFVSRRRFSGKRFEGLVAGLGVWFDEFWFEFSFPVREKYFSSWESDFSALSESRCKDTAFLIPSRAMPCDCETFSLKSPKILPVSLF